MHSFLHDSVQVLSVEDLVLHEPLELDKDEDDAAGEGDLESQFNALSHQEIWQVDQVEATQRISTVSDFEDHLQKGDVLGISQQVSAKEHHVKHAGDALEAVGGVAEQFFSDFGVTKRI